MNRERLERLVAVLDRVAEDPDLAAAFDLHNWVDGDPARVGCGTTACAIGHACLDPWFRSAGLVLAAFRMQPEGGWAWDESADALSAPGAVPKPIYGFDVDMAAVRSFFGLTTAQANRLFLSVCYPDPGYTETDQGPKRKPHDPRLVADRVRELLAEEAAGDA